VSYFKAKLHETRLRLGLYPRHRWASYSAPPDPLAGGRGRRTTGKGKGEGTWEQRVEEGREKGGGEPHRHFYFEPGLWFQRGR